MPGAPTFDLQSHSLHSDGALPAAEVVRLAAAAGVELLALTDHDTVDGVEEALRAGEAHGVRVVPAVEISAIESGHADVHVLGYALDHRDARLLAALAGWRADRELRAQRMADALRGLGFALADSELERRRAAGEPIGRPHLAAAVVTHPENAARLRAEGVAEPSAFLEAYLIEGAPAFRPRTTPTVEEAIAAIHGAGGVAVWAHPFWDVERDADALATIDRFAGRGLDGVECFYVTHSRKQTLLLCDRCQELGLLRTGSSDFHGPGHAHFDRFAAFDLHGREPELGPIAAV